MASLGRALGPPLKFLPKDLEPSELEAYRHDYQAFRAGHHLGAHGEIEGLQLRAQHAASQASLCSADGAYFSEPERGTTPPEHGKLMEDYNYKLAQTGPFWRGLAFLSLWKLGGHEQSMQSHGSMRFWPWLLDETASRPDETQLPRVPRSHLLEVARVPLRLEKVLAFGFLLCFDILLHELSFTPLQVLFATPRAVAHALFGKMVRPISVTEKCDMIRLSLLVANVLLQLIFFSNSWVYHYLRGESFLKLYVFFNMLELFERWLRSVGVDLFDLLATSCRQSIVELSPKYLLALAYCFVHSSMHMLRVLLLTVAINTSSSAVFLIIVTNNFGEIKSTVFKRYEVKSLFPILTSDIVERFYLALDIIFVLLRLAASERRGLSSGMQITSWLLLLVGIEFGTDWVKFCLIMKFSELPVAVLESYQQVLIADILVCRMRPTGSDSSAPCMPFRGIQSFSHVIARRIGFSGLPLSTLVLLHLPALSACQGSPHRLLVLLFVILALAKVLLSIILLGAAARRRGSISRGLELFGKIKAL